MAWYFYLANFFAGAFLVNAIPHLVAGVSGAKFQSPFAKPPGVGESSAMSNTLWGYFNLTLGLLLAYHFWPGGPHGFWGRLTMWVGGLAMAVQLTSHFGKVRAGK